MDTKRNKNIKLNALIVVISLFLVLGCLPMNSRNPINQHKTFVEYPLLKNTERFGANYYPTTILYGILDVGVWSRFWIDDRFIYVDAYSNGIYAAMNPQSVKRPIYKETIELSGIKFKIEVGFIVDIDEPQHSFTLIKFNQGQKYYIVMFHSKLNSKPYDLGENLREEDKAWIINFCYILVTQ